VRAMLLKLDRDDEERELEFELRYQLSLTTHQRFEMMFKRSEELRRLVRAGGRRKTFEIIKRT